MLQFGAADRDQFGRLRAPGERANADLKNWHILRKIRSSPAYIGLLVNAVQVVILNNG